MLLTRTTTFTADDVTATALLNCLVREVCAPEQQVWQDDAHLVVRLPRVGVVLRARLARPSAGPSYRLVPPYEERRDDEWLAAPWDRLSDLVAGELELATGEANPEFAAQVADSHAALTAILRARGDSPSGALPSPAVHRYVESEQSLIAGHRFHPSPKARQGAPEQWLPYAPEARARFRPHWLAVRQELVAEEGDTDAFSALEALGPAVPPGYRALPAHPWQLSLLADRPLLRRALSEGLVHDLGPCGPEAAPTSSVRTVYVPDADLFCKFSLDVRITNCVRKNSWYELAGAVVLDRLLRPVFTTLGARFDDCVLLAEPAYRTAALADRALYEGLGVILRRGIRDLPGTPLLAGALADPYGTLLPGLPAMATPDGALAWWRAYVQRVAPPVLHAYVEHGVVLEPHLQNVLIAVDDDGMPLRAVFRDLEGTKLVAGRALADELADLPPRVRQSLIYDPGRGWNRVVYCLFVNHLAETAAAVADLHPDLDAELWTTARAVLSALDIAHRPELRALLAGVPLPAKANLRARWARIADRGAGYVTAPNPLAPPAPLGP
ncbi:iron transporter [Actinomadura rubrobrunea]|uniref:Iron transporter n=1 Tax=Actinomadura rubrobrunea TaxID=115335 RepID=A0A9W6PSZ8_9ACTN|nr:IucA/IucC family protein [Actinomadura rubrobrunea]GLW62322.1 iron transporter [Actinomadura rubrobrunea]